MNHSSPRTTWGTFNLRYGYGRPWSEEEARGSFRSRLPGVRFGGVEFQDLHFESREYDKRKAYGQSRPATVLFAIALDARGAASDIRAFFATSWSNRHRSCPSSLRKGACHLAGEYKTAGRERQRASDVRPVHAGIGGVYRKDADIAPVRSTFSLQGWAQQLAGMLPWAIDPDLAERLWDASEKFTGIEFES